MNVREYLIKHEGKWFSPEKLATALDMNLQSVYNALRKFNKDDPNTCIKKYEERKVFYQARKFPIMAFEKSPEGEGRL